MCVKVGRGTSVVLIEGDKPVKQVLVLKQLIVSFERVKGVLVGTHAEVSRRQATQVATQLEALASEWQAS